MAAENNSDQIENQALPVEPQGLIADQEDGLINMVEDSDEGYSSMEESDEENSCMESQPSISGENLDL